VAEPSFRVDPELLKEVANASAPIAHFCHLAHYAMGNERAADGGDSFGEYGVLGAYREFFQRWRAEVRATEEAANEFGFGIVESRLNYEHSDGTAVQRFGSR
jgi:hypothetical protein